jgi:antitoxin VapB
MPLYIKDNATADLVRELARRRGVTKQDAVKLAVKAELDRTEPDIPFIDRLHMFWEANPMPPRTGLQADKQFFDDLSGEP